MAGPTKLSAARRKQICEALSNGNSRKASAESAGISRRTFQRWMSRGKVEKDGAFGAFHRDVIKAEAEAVCDAVSCLRKAAHKNWRAAAWWLERRHPKEWGARSAEDRYSRQSGPSRREDGVDGLKSSMTPLGTANVDAASTSSTKH